MGNTKKLRILAANSNLGGCAYYRIMLPMQKLAELYPDEVEVRFDDNPLGWCKETGKTTPENFEYENLKWADVVFTQNIHNFGGNYTIEIMRKAHELGKFTHFDTDDLLTNLYKGHRLYGVYEDQQLDEVTKYIYNNVDLVSVTQRKFAQRIAPFVNGALVVIKNAIDYSLPCWNSKKLPKPKKLTRVGWVGGIHHDVDIKHFSLIPHLVNQKVGPQKVHWGFYGKPQQPPGERDWQWDVWEGYEQQVKKGLRGQSNYTIFPAMPPNTYGEMYTNIDVNIAVLDNNEFNDSKSEIKAMECGRYGIPLVATNVGCYDEIIVNGQTGYLIDPSNPKKEWVKALSRCINDPKHVQEMGMALKTLCDELYDINKIVGGRLALYRQMMDLKKQALSDALMEQKEKNIVEDVTA
jgi:glycosyltransferase involved in cell wall biosynthesis